MAFNDIITGFRVQSTDPIDSRLVCADLVSRDAIPALARYEGLQTYVISEKEIYVLQEGIEDTNWVDITSAISEEFLTEYETKEQLVAKLGDAYLTLHETAAEIQAKLDGLFVPGGAAEAETLSHFVYDPASGKLIADRAIETTLNSLFLGEQHKMSSGSENIFFTNLTSDINFFPMWGGLKDQSLTVNQGASGFIPPSGRVYTDMFSLPLRGTPDPLTAVPYAGDNYFGVNITGLGITTTAAEEVSSDVRLEYRIEISGRNVYKQVLPRSAARSSAASHVYAGDVIEWFFDHPVDVRAGTTLYAEIMKVRISDDVDLGAFLVRQGSTANPDGSFQYQATVHNRLFEDKDLELISPYLKYKAMDFGLDATGSTVFLRDLSLGADSLLVPHPINALEAIANGTEIRIKLKGGAKIIVESLPVNAITIDGSYVNSVLNTAIVELNAIFTNTSGFTGGGGSDTFVNSFNLTGNDLTLGLNDGTSFTTDVTTLGVDEDKFVTSAVLNGTIITLSMNDATSVFIDAAGLAIDNDTTITSGSVTGNTLNLTKSDGSIIAIDASALGGSSSLNVVSGSVIGSDLVLVMSDASTISIDASNMINGSTSLASGSGWFISYGTNANDAVGTSTNDSTINQQLPLYFGEALTTGSEFRWNFQSGGGSNLILGIWDGAESPIAYNGGANTASNWGTSFTYAGGFIAGSNSTLTNTTNGTKYIVNNGDALGMRFLSDGILTLIDYSGGGEIEIARTTNPLAVSSFNIQMYTWANGVLPNGIISDSNFLWQIEHDYAGTEAGVLDGVLTHTVLKRNLALSPGEKYMIPLNKQGAGETFGIDYTGASTGVVTAEDQLLTSFKYQTNESIIADVNWSHNTASTRYFTAGGGTIPSWRQGGAGTQQGLFSLRYTVNNTLEIWSETYNDLVATSIVNPDGSDIYLYYGVNGNTQYVDLPNITKQTIGQGSQPDANFVPTVANQTVSITQGDVLNYQIVSSNNIVNQFVEEDAPSWMSLNQNTGILSGTAPAHTGTAADTIVVNCKAGNAVGGTVNFTVTVTITAPSYTNTKSLDFNGTSTYMQGNPVNMNSLERATNGDGNAWSVSMWVKPNTTTSNQTLFVYGAGDDYNGGAITLKQSGGTSLVLNYGTVYNSIILVGGNALTTGAWNHILVTFDGGTTGSVPADSSDYYSRFNIYVDGTSLSTIGVATGGGYDGAISGANPSDNIYRIGRASNVHNNYFGGIINQVGIWSSDESSNVSSIYASGATQDLSLLSSAPDHYYEIEASATSISDVTGSADLVGYNFSTSDLVSDIP